MSETNWKAKYLDLRMKMMNAVDTSFRIGFEQGAKEAQMQAQADAAAQAQAQAQQQQEAAMGGAPGQEGEEAGAPGQEQGGEQPQGMPSQGAPGQQGQDAGGSELDQHINTLQSMVQKSEVLGLKPEALAEINKSLDLMKAEKQAKQAKLAIASIAKSLSKPNKVFNMSESAKSNLSTQAKHAVSMQERVISDVMKSWEEEEKRAGKDVLSVLAAEGILKKD